MLQRYVTQLPVDTNTLKFVADRAGCPRKRRSTAGILSRKAWEQGGVDDTDGDRVVQRKVRNSEALCVVQL